MDVLQAGVAVAASSGSAVAYFCVEVSRKVCNGMRPAARHVLLAMALNSLLIVRLWKDEPPEQPFGMGEAKSGVNKLTARRNQQSASDVVGE